MKFSVDIIKKNKMTLKKITAGIGALFLALSLASCESIYDKDMDCTPYYYLEFKYDMNMDFADAFSSKVSSVEVYAFDHETGALKGKFADSGDDLKEYGYKMRVDLEPGNYDFITWCGLEDNDDDFILDQDIKRMEDLSCIMSRDYDEEGKATQNRELHALYHGMINAVLEDLPGPHVYPVPLVKDTNTINFSLNDQNGKELDPDRFTIKLKATNGYMGHDNTLHDDEEIEYHPYRKVSGSVDLESRADESEGDGKNLVVAELATARLISNHNPQLEVYDNDNDKLIISIPLVRWILEMKSSDKPNLGNQEYLDREDEFNIILYIHDDVVDPQYFIAASILINGWRKVLQNAPLGQ